MKMFGYILTAAAIVFIILVILSVTGEAIPHPSFVS